MLFGWLAKAARTALAAVKSAGNTVWKAAKSAGSAAWEAATAVRDAVRAKVKQHPVLAGIVASSLFTIIIPGLAVVVVIGVLSLIGFGPAGVGAGTAAAAFQASIGNVAAPSLFATLTSAAAGGYGIASITVAVQAVAAVIAAAAAACWFGMD